MATPRPKSARQEIVYVLGPVDTTPGKKQTYPIRPMKRGLAESPEVRALGIMIQEGYRPGEDDRTIEVENKVTQHMRGRKSNAEKELEKVKAELEALKAQMTNAAKPKQDAEANP